MGEIQRARLLMAAVEVVSELGYSGMSASRVAGRAGVSRRTFYEVFSDREACFLAVFDDAVARATAAVRDATVEVVGWRDQVRAGLSTLLLFIGDEPGLGALVIVDALSAGPEVLARRAQGLETLITAVDRGRSQAQPGHDPPPLTAEGVVGAVLSVLHARLLERSDRPLVELLNSLMAIIVLPYLGQEAAAQELARPTPKVLSSPTAPSATGDPLKGLNMRLTYRTLRVLSAVAELGGRGSGPSNREVAEAAGVQDEGQISRLLARLERLGLVGNSGLGQTKGEVNAWALTARGEELEGALQIDPGPTAR